MRQHIIKLTERDLANIVKRVLNEALENDDDDDELSQFDFNDIEALRPQKSDNDFEEYGVTDDEPEPEDDEIDLGDGEEEGWGDFNDVDDSGDPGEPGGGPGDPGDPNKNGEGNGEDRPEPASTEPEVKPEEGDIIDGGKGYENVEIVYHDGKYEMTISDEDPKVIAKGSTLKDVKSMYDTFWDNIPYQEHQNYVNDLVKVGHANINFDENAPIGDTSSVSYTIDMDSYTK